MIQSAAKGTILIIDDTPANLDLLSSMLLEQGYDVRAVTSGNMAFKVIRVDAPDLILLDIKMPDIDGYEVCRLLKQDEYSADIPVIFISSLDETLDKVKAFRSGGVDYITKPFQIEEVLARVESQLTLYQQHRKIEEQHRAIESLREQDRLYFEELNRLKDQFLKMASHDLKNPIGIVMGYADMLLAAPNGSLSDPKIRGRIEKIRGASKQMQLLVTDLLDFARLQAELILNLSTISLNPFLKNCVDTFELLAREKRLQLNFYPSSTDISITIDPKRMEQVISNLLSNAIKYTLPEGKVELSVDTKDDSVILYVMDTGLGIPEKDVPHLFESFFRVSREEHLLVEGTGLGLSIVKLLVERHQGTIQVQSVLGQGSTFSVILPKGKLG